MLQQLISHRPDLKQLQDEGYHIEVCGGYLVIHHIPYVNPSKEVRYGRLICHLNLVGPNKLNDPKDHTIFFSGNVPSKADGSPMTEIINNSNRRQLTTDIIIDHYFSSKPPSGKYANYYDKIRTYTEILKGQAIIIDPTVTAKPLKSK